MIISFLFKSGFELWVECENFEASVNKLTGKLTEYKIEGIKDNKPLYIDFDELACIYRVSSSEEIWAE